jgi:hypothetical protein
MAQKEYMQAALLVPPSPTNPYLDHATLTSTPAETNMPVPIDMPKSDTLSIPCILSLQDENNMDMCDATTPVKPEYYYSLRYYSSTAIRMVRFL